MSNDFYPELASFDLREEFEKLLYGSYDGPPIYQTVMVRFIQDEKCACFDANSGSPDALCPWCNGEGFLFDEVLKDCYIARNWGNVLNPSSVIQRQNFLGPYGYTDENRAMAYMDYKAFPRYERYLKPEHPTYDKLYELKVDDNGELSYPLVRVAKWNMKSVTAHHGDWGRIEYFEIGLEKQNI